MADPRAKHLAAIGALRATREFRRSSRLLGPICEALEYALDPHDGAAPIIAPADQDHDSDGADSSHTEVADEETELLQKADAVIASWSVAEEPAPAAEPEVRETRAQRLAKREKAVRKRLNSKAGPAEAAARVKRVLANTAGPAMTPGRVSNTTPEAAAALREVGRDGRPAAFAINLYV